MRIKARDFHQELDIVRCDGQGVAVRHEFGTNGNDGHRRGFQREIKAVVLFEGIAPSHFIGDFGTHMLRHCRGRRIPADAEAPFDLVHMNLRDATLWRLGRRFCLARFVSLPAPPRDVASLFGLGIEIEHVLQQFFVSAFRLSKELAQETLRRVAHKPHRVGGSRFVPFFQFGGPLQPVSMCWVLGVTKQCRDRPIFDNDKRSIPCFLERVDLGDRDALSNEMIFRPRQFIIALHEDIEKRRLRTTRPRTNSHRHAHCNDFTRL